MYQCIENKGDNTFVVTYEIIRFSHGMACFLRLFAHNFYDFKNDNFHIKKL